MGWSCGGNLEQSQQLLQQISLKADQPIKAQAQQFDQWVEFGPTLLLLLLPFAAYSFRRGVLACGLLSLLMLPISPSVKADVFKTTNQQGQQDN